MDVRSETQSSILYKIGNALQKKLTLNSLDKCLQPNLSQKNKKLFVANSISTLKSITEENPTCKVL